MRNELWNVVSNGSLNLAHINEREDTERRVKEKASQLEKWSAGTRRTVVVYLSITILLKIDPCTLESHLLGVGNR